MFWNEVCAFQNKQLDGDHIWYLLILGEELVESRNSIFILVMCPSLPEDVFK